jgi:hypothetical protein
MKETEFRDFGKIPRFSRDIIITEKIDGTNAQIFIDENNNIKAGSRNKWITPGDDNYGFAKWVKNNKQDLLKLGEGRHFGEWWGSGIQRKYGLTGNDKRFSLFNVKRWTNEELPSCVSLVPIIYEGEFNTIQINTAIQHLKDYGSIAAPGFINPEGIIIYHTAGNLMFKKTIEKDEIPKSLIK